MTVDDAVVKLWVLATIAGIVLSMTACSVSTYEGLATTAQPSVLSSPVSEPDYSSVLHPNYRVVTTSALDLGGGPTPDRIVVSAGPGLDAGKPVDGGTQDVQILSYDAIAERWNVTFDAANTMTAAGSLDAVPLLPQTNRLASVTVKGFRADQDKPAYLLITGVDSTANHPLTLTGIVSLSDGVAKMAYRSNQDMNATVQVEGPDTGPQTLTVASDYFPPWAPACCPLRKYTRTIGARGDAGLLIDLSDDRPWLGVWLGQPSEGDGPTGSGVVVSTIPGSPASAVLQPGDLILGVKGAAVPVGRPVYAFDEVGSHYPGDSVTLRISRHGQDSTVGVTLGSMADPHAAQPSAPIEGFVGIQVQPAAGSTPGLEVADVSAGAPAARAGMQEGQIVTAADDVPVRTFTDLLVALTNKAGHSLTLTVVDPSTHGSSSLTVSPQIAPSGRLASHPI
ncbi:PDZ domain-containing protein [Rhodococcus sp. T2V]|uniref:PDZ domain-containing protein n=1 Tax=Rhodococcus sp. T2V TaxID=3034164 RepID=UPI0023E31348|nr:PDZ domain-containing protein [Rhodococcus sp. T2V]MDF3313481.1 PDZ domain-containing protein [Rhodococcus sp. T2V]